MTRRRLPEAAQVVSIRLTPAELAEVDGAAQAAGETRTEYIRRAALDRARAPGLADRVRAAIRG